MKRTTKYLLVILFLLIIITMGQVILLTTTFGWNVTDKLLRLKSNMKELGIIKTEPSNPNIIEDEKKKMIFASGGVLIINCKGIWQKDLVHRLPYLSADGKKLLFLEIVSRYGCHSLKFEAWVMEIKSGKKKRLLSVSDSPIETPYFLPDGKVLSMKTPYFLPDGKVLFPGMFILDIEKNKRESIIGRGGMHSSLSPDGKMVVFEAREANLNGSNIYIMNIKDTEKKQLTFTEAECNINPSFSPDSKEIVFESREKGRNKICLMNTDGEKLRTLKDDLMLDNSYPSFSPDGKKIIYLSGEKESEYDYWLCIMNRDGTEQKRLIDLKNYGYEHPRGRHLFYGYSFLSGKFIFLLREADSFNLYTLNLDGTDKKRVVKMEDMPYFICLRYPMPYSIRNILDMSLIMTGS